MVNNLLPNRFNSPFTLPNTHWPIRTINLIICLLTVYFRNLIMRMRKLLLMGTCLFSLSLTAQENYEIQVYGAETIHYMKPLKLRMASLIILNWGFISLPITPPIMAGK
jgi:hypothetical protein